MLRLFQYVMRFIRYVVSPLCVVVSALCNVVSLFRKSSLLPVSSIIIQVPLFLKNPFIQFLLEPSAHSSNLRGNSKMVGVSEGEENANLSSVLEKLHLGHLLENFQRKKVTVDQIFKLSSNQMEC